MKSSLYIPQWEVDNGSYAIHPPRHNSEDFDVANVPILIELKGPSPGLAEGGAAVGPGSGIGSGSGIVSSAQTGSSLLQVTDESNLNLWAPSLRKSTAELPNISMNVNIDFLYQVGEERYYPPYSNSMLSFFQEFSKKRAI
jgi:hypothetical protein